MLAFPTLREAVGRAVLRDDAIDTPAGRPRGALGIELASSAVDLERLRPDYDRLHRVTGNTFPFALHDWHVTWWKHFAARGRRVVDALRVYVVRDRAHRAVGIVPFVATDRHFGPLAVRTLAMLGPDPYISELRGPLVEPGYEEDVARLLHARLSANDADNKWDWILWTGLNERFARALDDGRPIQWLDPTVDYEHELPSTWEAFRRGLKRNIRESLRHCYNSLKRDGYEFEFEVASKPVDVSRAVEQFLTLHAMRAEMTAGVPHRDRFHTPKSKEFLRDVALRLSARGVTRVFLLKIQGRVVAARMGFVVGRSLYLYFSGYDPAWRKYSVMTTTVAEAIRYAIEQRLSRVSLSVGTDISKTRWGAHAVPWAEGIECRSALRSRIAHAAYQRASSWRERRAAALTTMLDLLPKRGW
jgi:CelD/BcsL family acetyltransferase involved in cellulose biosynthesis